MRLANNVVRFEMGGIPVVGNVTTGTIVGLTQEGAELCDAMASGDVPANGVPADCIPLIKYLHDQGFLEQTDKTDGLRLRSSYLHVTNACNLDCIGCYSADPKRNRAANPRLEDLQHAVSVLVKLGVTELIISGGEPFMRLDLSELVCQARNDGIQKISILTNGTCCTRETVVSLAEFVDTISVSFDGVSATSLAHVRKTQLFDRLVEAVEVIKTAGIQAHILPTIHAKNIEDVPAYIDLAKRLGTTISFSLLSGPRELLGDLAPDNDGLKRLADIMFDVGVGANGAGLDAIGDPERSLTACVSCGAGVTSISVAADGSLYPCHMLHAKPFILGNIFFDSLEEIKANIASFSLPSVDLIEGCSKCEKRYLCGGGCRARSHRETGRLDGRDPYCAYYRRALDRAVGQFIKARCLS